MRMKKSSHLMAIDPFSAMTAGKPRSKAPRSSTTKPSPNIVELGLRFRRLREGQGLSLEQTAHRTGSSPTAIARFEREGEISGELLLTLVRTMSSATDLDEAFLVPRYSNIRQVVSHERIRRS